MSTCVIKSTALTVITSLSLHDALPILLGKDENPRSGIDLRRERPQYRLWQGREPGPYASGRIWFQPLHPMGTRSEEHTSELQSLAYLVCRLLLAITYGRRGRGASVTAP